MLYSFLTVFNIIIFIAELQISPECESVSAQKFNLNVQLELFKEDNVSSADRFLIKIWQYYNLVDFDKLNANLKDSEQESRKLIGSSTATVKNNNQL